MTLFFSIICNIILVARPPSIFLYLIFFFMYRHGILRQAHALELLVCVFLNFYIAYKSFCFDKNRKLSLFYILINYLYKNNTTISIPSDGKVVRFSIVNISVVEYCPFHLYKLGEVFDIEYYTIENRISIIVTQPN